MTNAAPKYRYMVIFSNGVERQIFADTEAEAKKLAKLLVRGQRVIKGQYAEAYPFVEAAWWRHSNTLVLLECADLEALERAALAAGITHVRFVEPDWAPEGTLTALVLGPDGKRLARELRLAFSSP